MKKTAETDAPEPAEKKQTKWWVILLTIVLLVVFGYCLLLLIGPAVADVYEQVMNATL